MAITFISRVDITPSAGSPQDIDVSAYVSASTKVALIHVINTSTTTDYSFWVRPNGSTDNRYNDIYRNCQCYGVVGVDEDGIFEAKIENTAVKIYLMGYDEGEFEFFVNAPNISTGATADYVDVDISAYTGTDTPLGVAFEIYSTVFDNIGYRPKGFTTGTHTSNPYQHSAFCNFCRVNEYQIFQIDCDNAGIYVYLTAYVISGIYFPPPDEWSYLRFLAGWEIQGADWYSPSYYGFAYPRDFASGVEGLLVENTYNYTSARSFDIREEGSADANYYDIYRRASSIVKVSSNELIEARSEAYYPGGTGTDYTRFTIHGLIGDISAFTKHPSNSPTKVFIYDDSAGTYTDETTDATNIVTSDFYLFPSTVGAGDKLIFCSQTKPTSFTITIGTAGAGTFVVVPQYWDGSSWQDLDYSVEFGTFDMKSKGHHRISFTGQTYFNKFTISSQLGYWFAISYVSGTITTRPIGTRILFFDPIQYNKAVIGGALKNISKKKVVIDGALHLITSEKVVKLGALKNIV